ncbi:MAG: type IV pilus secretin PilQ [Desulfobacterales bacterium]|nr:MAG: type IV pilus secretin PilQ [Desulfobacterales bacterium]
MNQLLAFRRKAVLIILLISPIILLYGCASNKAAEVSAEGQKLITDIITSEDAKSTIVTVKSNHLLTYTSIKQVFPVGVLFHFPDTSLDKIKTVYEPPDNDIISSIKATEIKEDDNTTTSRIFIALKRDVPYDIAPGDAGLHISFPKAAAVATQTETPPSKEKPTAKQPQPPSVMKKVPTAIRLKSVAATPLQKNVVINVKADGTIKNYKTFTMDNPPRIVIDMFKLQSPFKKEQRIKIKSKWVKQIRHFGHQDKVRMVLETDKAYLSKFSTTPIDNGLLIHVGQIPSKPSKKVQSPVIAQTPKPVKTQEKKEPRVNETKPVAIEKKKPEAKKEVKEKKYDEPAWVNRIDFTSEETGKSAIIIGTTRPVKYEIKKIADRRLHLKLFDTNLPEYRKRALITTRFESAVDRITPVQTPAMKNESIFTIELREAVPYFVEQKDNLIRVNFTASKIPPKPYEDADLPAWKKVLVEAEVEPKKKAEKAKVPAAIKEAIEIKERIPVAEKSLEERLAQAKPEKKYTGEKIALDFYDTDIKNVFRILREISGKNFAIDKNVTGKVTLTLEKPVPWDQVLDLVLKMNQLGMTMEGDIIRIATLTTLAQEEKLRQAKLKAEQQAKKQQEALEPLFTEYIPINYSNANTEVLPHVQVILTENRGKVSVDARNNQLIMTDTVAKIKQAKEIVQKIDQVTPQVIIEARIVEANTDFTRTLGFDWGTVTLDTFDLFGGTFGPTTFLADNLPPADPTAVLGFSFVKGDFSILNASLEASETEGLTNILSAPKIVTLDNKKAKIKQGFEVPYLERDSSGNATTRFKDVDLLLEVTPSVTPDDRISLSIFVTKNEVFQETDIGPALSTNEAKTEILMDDGDTVVIGGILKSTKVESEDRIPGLGKIPVLGWLFKSQIHDDTKNELLIFITPQIVKLEQKKL